MARNSAIDMTGQRFGRLTVVGRAKNIDDGAAWLCSCDCGGVKNIRGYTLRRGRTRSCGCLSKETAANRVRIHGATAGKGTTPEYRSYRNMLNRCLNKNHEHYANYGGRGISICERWLSGFSAFLADMGIKPTPAHTIDRRDNNGHYEPDNCRWATRKEQNRNARTVRPVERSDGVKYRSAGEAAEAVDGTPSGVYSACRDGNRLYRGYRWQFSAPTGTTTEQLRGNAGASA